jgi:hypothetical protein
MVDWARRNFCAEIQITRISCVSAFTLGVSFAISSPRLLADAGHMIGRDRTRSTVSPEIHSTETPGQRPVDERLTETYSEGDEKTRLNEPATNRDALFRSEDPN